MKVLAIESSCDDTSFAVVNDDKTVDFHETINHRKFHREHGGVVPEMAARQHLDIMDHLSTFKKKINFANIDAIASTYGPGLIGGLIVGSSFAKGLALSQQKKLSPSIISKLIYYPPVLSPNYHFRTYVCSSLGVTQQLCWLKVLKNLLLLALPLMTQLESVLIKLQKQWVLDIPVGPSLKSSP